jgi:HlyD family secretion protein
MMGKYGKYVVAVLAVIGLAIAIGTIIQGNQTAPVIQPIVKPAKVPFASYVAGAGIVEARTENIAVGTPVSGIVSAIYVKWGDQVKIEDALFTIDTRDLQGQLPSAAAKVREAKANLEKIKNRARVGDELGVSISAEEMANRRFDVAIDEAAVAAAEAQVEQIKTEIGRRTIRARSPGRILQIKMRLGEFAQSGVLSTPLMLLGDDTRFHVRVDLDENDAWRVQPCAPAMAFLRGNPNLNTPLQFVRIEPYVIPKTSLTNESVQRTDTRVLQVVYSFDHAALPAYVGQQMDVFIEAPPVGAANSGEQRPSQPCRDSEVKDPSDSNLRQRKP